MLSRRNGRRVLHGALNAATGKLMQIARERGRQDDGRAFVQTLDHVQTEVSKLLTWDNAQLRHPKRVSEAVGNFRITIALLLFRVPELNPCGDPWHLMKAVVAANHCLHDLDTLARHAIAWLSILTTGPRLLCTGLLGEKFQWLST